MMKKKPPEGQSELSHIIYSTLTIHSPPISFLFYVECKLRSRTWRRARVIRLPVLWSCSTETHFVFQRGTMSCTYTKIIEIYPKFGVHRFSKIKFIKHYLFCWYYIK